MQGRNVRRVGRQIKFFFVGFVNCEIFYNVVAVAVCILKDTRPETVCNYCIISLAAVDRAFRLIKFTKQRAGLHFR